MLQFAETKNGRRRDVPMNRAVYDVLANLPGKTEEGPVFRRKDGAAGATSGARSSTPAGARRSPTFASTTCASWMITRGRSLKAVQEILGHREFSMTLRYAHLSPDRPREAVAALEEFRNGTAQKISTGW